MSKIFTIAVKFTYDFYSRRFFRYKFICKETEYYWRAPIFANNEQEAFEIYNKRNNIDNCILHMLWDEKARNIVKEVVCCDQNYTIEDLQKKMDSTDFLHYCKQELGLEQTINYVTNK